MGLGIAGIVGAALFGFYTGQLPSVVAPANPGVEEIALDEVTVEQPTLDEAALEEMLAEMALTENAIAERVNGILKHEYGLSEVFRSFGDAKAALKEAVYLYNNERPHLALGYQTPAQVHRRSLKRWN